MTEQELKEEFRQEMLQEAYEEEKHRIQLEEDPLDYIMNKYADKLQEAYDLMTPIVNELFDAGIEVTHSDLIKEI